MQQEEILIQGEAIKTIIKYFTTFSGQTSDDNSIYYLITDINNNPLKLSQSILETEFGLDYNNYNIPLSAISAGYNIYTGSVIQNEVAKKIEPSERAYVSEDYIDRIKYQATQNQIPNASIFSYVLFEEVLFNDYFLNIKINRGVEVLNTLNVYNVPINESPKFNNDTGVLFGKIEAIQLLLDDEGNKLRVPIRNAVVGIFNASDEIPSIGSVDENGNRIQLNLFENLTSVNGANNLPSYGSFQSYLTDATFSPKDLGNDTIPAKYKYTSLTNEFGEFVIHNIPTGQQTLMLEVDLLKQGLEPEEVALNFFPYPTNDDPNVSTIPHLYFNQFPVNIVPSWGELQTGYTQIELSIVLDLRKWITFFTYPISSKLGNPQNISNTNFGGEPKVLEELNAVGINNPFNVLIRDMTKPFVVDVLPKIELVKIIDVYDRNLDLKSSWNQEFKIKSNKIDFNTTNFNAFKLPANLYDPDGFDTNGNKGVWLGAYQIKTSFPDPSISCQTTGFAENWPTDLAGNVKYFKVNHFDLNRFTGWENESNSPPPGSGIGKYPYEKPWSLTYPDNYRVTRKPSIINPLKSWNPDGSPNLNPSVVNRNGITNTFNLSQGEFFLQPRFMDGDMAGGPDAWATNANGYGLQQFNQVFAGNNFSREVTKNEIWRYEAVDHWTEEWSNGYNAGLTQYNLDKYPQAYDWAGKPDIAGERYQRLEAGYAYWLKPRGWPRIKNQAWGDHLLDNDYNPFANHDKNFVYQSPNEYNSYYPSIYNYIDEITLLVGNQSTFFAKFGRLNIYRIEKPYYLNPRKPPFTAKFARFNLQQLIVDQSKKDSDVCKDCGPHSEGFIWLQTDYLRTSPSYSFRKRCEIKFTRIENYRTGQLRIVNIGTTKVTINGKELVPGGWNQGIDFETYSFFEIVLPANDKYNPNTNSYEGASYLFYLGETYTPRGIKSIAGIVQPIYKYPVGVEGEEKNYYLTSMVPREVGLGSDKCSAAKDYDTGTEPYDSAYRRERNYGVFINGLAYGEITNPYKVSRKYFDAKGFLPYVGEGLDDARAFDIRNNVPYQGTWFFSDFLKQLDNGGSLMAFQPKPLKNDERPKGYNNVRYYLEGIYVQVQQTTGDFQNILQQLNIETDVINLVNSLNQGELLTLQAQGGIIIKTYKQAFDY